jgi:hypothetical protein
MMTLVLPLPRGELVCRAGAASTLRGMESRRAGLAHQDA